MGGLRKTDRKAADEAYLRMQQVELTDQIAQEVTEQAQSTPDVLDAPPATCPGCNSPLSPSGRYFWMTMRLVEQGLQCSNCGKVIAVREEAYWTYVAAVKEEARLRQERASAKKVIKRAPRTRGAG